MSDIMPRTLHPEYFDGPFADGMRHGLEDRLADFHRKWREGDQRPLDGITAVLYSYNDSPQAVTRAFDDIRNQIFVKDVETIFVDAGDAASAINREARMVACQYGARIGRVAIGPAFRADILNKGIEMARTDNVWMMPAHAAMASNVTLAAARWQMKPNDNVKSGELVVGGVYGVVIPDENASGVECVGGHLMGATKRLLQKAGPQQPGKAGYLDASCSMVSKRAVEGIRPTGYPVEFGAGGADGELGRRMHNGGYMYIDTDKGGPRSKALQVIEDGGLAVHHTHGLSSLDSPRQWLDAFRQLRRWQQMGEPRDFVREKWLWHPNLGL